MCLKKSNWQIAQWIRSSATTASFARSNRKSRFQAEVAAIDYADYTYTISNSALQLRELTVQAVTPKILGATIKLNGDRQTGKLIRSRLHKATALSAKIGAPSVSLDQKAIMLASLCLSSAVNGSETAFVTQSLLLQLESKIFSAHKGSTHIARSK